MYFFNMLAWFISFLVTSVLANCWFAFLLLWCRHTCNLGRLFSCVMSVCYLSSVVGCTLPIYLPPFLLCWLFKCLHLVALFLSFLIPNILQFVLFRSRFFLFACLLLVCCDYCFLPDSSFSCNSFSRFTAWLPPFLLISCIVSTFLIIWLLSYLLPFLHSASLILTLD